MGISDIGPLGSGFTPLAALRAHQTASNSLRDTLERLATGKRINRGRDDPAGLITSENLRAALASLDAESRRLERMDHVVATADAALGEISDLLVEAEGLVVANANEAGVTPEEREANQMQIDAIVGSINRIASTSSFNGENLLDGSLTVESGGTSVTVDDVTLGPIGEGEAALAALSDHRTNVAALRGELGSFSRYTIGSRLAALSVATENMAAAESQIRDTDYGLETANLARDQLLVKSSLKAIGLVNSARTNILDLLG
ncbi:MAG: flagellin [Planctomycetota bacterium]|jgi:flagellin-like hook-associated protein FlgL